MATSDVVFNLSLMAENGTISAIHGKTDMQLIAEFCESYKVYDYVFVILPLTLILGRQVLIGYDRYFNKGFIERHPSVWFVFDENIIDLFFLVSFVRLLTMVFGT